MWRPTFRPWCIGRGQKHRRAATVAGFSGRAGEDNEKTRAVRAADEVLVPGDLPAAGHLSRAGTQRRGIRAGTGRGLSHCERGTHLSTGERSQELLFPTSVGDAGQHVDVALVGCRDIHRRRAEQGVTGLLENRRAVHHVEPKPAIFDRRVRREHARIACRLLQFDPDQVTARRCDVTAMGIFDRKHQIADECPGALRQGGHRC